MSNQSGWSRVARRIRVPLGFVFAAVFFWLAMPSGRSLISGSLVALVGLWLRAVASGHVKKNEQLATTGPYAYTRNPLYLGSILIGLGFAAMSRNWWILVGIAVLFAAIYVPVIRSEEEFLRSRFAEFDNYAKSVPRLVPRFRVSGLSAHKPDETFSSELYWKHREYNAVIGAAAMFLALIVKLIWFKM